MRPGEWTLRSRRVVTPTGTRPLDLVIRGETIEALGEYEASDRDGVILDVGSRVVLPGVVDLHVHVQEVGPDEAEGFETATRAAAAGGVTTLIDLPMFDRPASTGARAMAAKLAASVGKLWVDCGFHGGLVAGGSAEVEPLADSGVLSVVATLGPSCDDFPPASPADLRDAMNRMARLDRPLMLHVGIESSAEPVPGTSADDDEIETIQTLIGLARGTSCRVHILHLSDAGALPLIASAKAEGLPLTVETCPHYLVLVPGEIPGGDGRFRIIPPVRDRPNREALWEGLRSGVIDGIGSGHLPFAPADRRARTAGARGIRPGVASIQVSLPAVWTEARQRGFTPDDLARWMSARPASIVGLAGRKGAIAPGADADLVVFDPDGSFLVDPNRLFHRHPTTPYEGRTLFGLVDLTVLRGRVIHESGRLHGEPHGVPVLRLEDTLPTAAGLDRLNRAGEAEALASLLRCCGSSRWAYRLAALRPFRLDSELYDAADRIWSSLERPDRLEAFRAHHRLSERESRAPRRARSLAGGSDEGESLSLVASMAQADLTYEAKFGHPFFVGEIDLPMSELLARIRRRLSNEPDVEYRLVSDQQAELTRLELRSLVS